ncbi:glutamyl-tRNA reductase [Aminipila butyrica]|uniref:Glutamyl-tRNA reductase n=1 Tax=Aminipila butyrica TaxID=433296 RepID=A0A858BVV7_9FIRM|nr:glutamyl-tRNA reductase [Aminipila butyrica]QIB68884.1 glutamyl-tRNA reductase [Aminipila butyrica]
MHIRMVGIDHSKASLDYREAFSFTKAGAKEAVQEIKKRFHLKGCILLSTCNRTELWISQCDNGKGAAVRPWEMLCQIKKIDGSQYEKFFVEREDRQAVDHLLRLVCGFDSKIFGEDQIISQVREALQMSRACGCGSMALEKIFQTALAAGKRVKTEVRLSTVNRSAASNTIAILRQQLGDLKGVPCLIIGNGQMGKLVANSLVGCGAAVSMTLRKKIHGQDEQESIVPEGCQMVPYDQRIQALQGKQVIISATLSPHYTLMWRDVDDVFRHPYRLDSEGQKREAGSREDLRNKYYVFDLAVPRDIDPEIANLPYVKLFDIDSINGGELVEEKSEQIQLAMTILQDYQAELEQWFEFRSYVPKIREIVELVSEDAMQRFVSKSAESQEEDLEAAAGQAMKKSTAKLLYGLRDQLPHELWDQCLEALHRSAARETLKH